LRGCPSVFLQFFAKPATTPKSFGEKPVSGGDLASITIVALAAISILVVLEVIPRSAFTEMAGKTALIAGVCVISALAIGLLSKR
jgi:hypothetical protein